MLGRDAGRFGRMEPRRHARAFVLGLLADLPRKNCWTIAKHAGDATPDGMQHLLDDYPGDHRPARRRPRRRSAGRRSVTVTRDLLGVLAAPVVMAASAARRR